MEKVRNVHGILVKKGCMSCQYREIIDGARFCKLTQWEVTASFVCKTWEMSDGMRNAGLKNGGVVRLRGTQEIVIE